MGVLRELHGHCDTRVIRRWEELGRHLGNQNKRYAKYQEQQQCRSLTPLNNEAKHTLIKTIEPLKELIDRLVDDTDALISVSATIELKHICREHRCKGDSRSGRYTHHDSHNPTELLEEDTCHTGNHGQRHEHRNYNKCCSDNREPYLVCSVDSRLLRLRATLDMR